MKLQKLGGYASIILICLVVLVILTAVILGLPLRNTDPDPVEAMTNFETYSGLVRLAQVIGILLAIYMVLITLALKERMRSNAPNLMRFAIIAASIAAALVLANTMIGIPALNAIAGVKDVSSFTLLSGIRSGINSASNHAWSWALLLMGIAAIKTRVLPKILGYIILISGIGGILVFAIQLTGIVAVLAPIVLVWLGIFLIQNPEPSQG